MTSIRIYCFLLVVLVGSASLLFAAADQSGTVATERATCGGEDGTCTGTADTARIPGTEGHIDKYYNSDQHKNLDEGSDEIDDHDGNDIDEEEDGEEDDEDEDDEEEDDEQEEEYDEDEEEDEEYEDDDIVGEDDPYLDENAVEKEERIWRTATLKAMHYKLLDCEAIANDVTSRIPTQEDWQTYYRVYREVMAMDETVESSIPSEITSSAFRVPFEVKTSEDTGRAVFVTEDVAKGTLVWDTTNTAHFKPNNIRQFWRYLPRRLACNLRYWIYARMDKDGEIYVCLDLDAGTLMNGIDQEILDEENEDPNTGANVGFLKGMDTALTGCNFELYALRDMKAGEEIRVRYDMFDGTNSFWNEMEGLY